MENKLLEFGTWLSKMQDEVSTENSPYYEFSLHPEAIVFRIIEHFEKSFPEMFE